MVATEAPRRRLRLPEVGALLPRATVDVHPVAAATRRGQESPSDLPLWRAWRDVQAMYRTGLHPAIALHVMHRRRVVMDRTIGHLVNEPGGPTGPVATPQTLFNLFSASKIITAALVHALVDDGLLRIDMPVVDVLPEFSSHGKDRILLRHLLNHTAGIPHMPQGVDLDALIDAGRFPVELLWDLRPTHPPGRRVAYHPMTSWFLIQELAERVTGEGLRPLLRRRLLDPLGFAHLDYGVRPDQVPDVALHALTGPPVPGVMDRIFTRTVGVGVDDAVRLTNDPRFLTAVLPSANVIATPAEVSRFLSMLLAGGELDGVRVLSHRAVRAMTTAATPRAFEGTFGFPMRYGLGVMMGGRRFSLFGLNTAGAFGHLGLSNVVVFADPARDLVVTFLNTGKPMMDPGMLRWYRVLQRIASIVPRDAPRAAWRGGGGRDAA